MSLSPLFALLLAYPAQAGPAARVQAAMSADLGALGVSADQARGVWGAPPAVVSQEDLILAGAGKDADAPLGPNDAPYSFSKDGTTTECKTVAGRIRWKYCVTKTIGSASRTVLYYLHGHGNNAESWISSGDYKRKIRQDWKAVGAPAPIVVTVSFGGFWLLVDKNGSDRSGLLPFFVSDVMPTIEKDLGYQEAPRRLLIGQSMGGYNAVQLVMKYPALFSKAALAFPAVAHVSPFASKQDIDAYKAQPGVSAFRVWMMIHLARKVFKNQADFLKSDPFTLGKTELGAGTPPLLVSVGDRDSFGLYESVGGFVDLARSRGVSVSYDVIAGGGHVSADGDHIASFLTP